VKTHAPLSATLGDKKTSGRPIRNATFAGANTAMLLVALAMFGVFFFVNGFQAALEVAAIIAFAGALTAVLLIRHTPSAEPEASTETIAA